MNCEICGWLKMIVNNSIDKGNRAEMMETRRLARTHFRRFHPDPFEAALDETELMN